MFYDTTFNGQNYNYYGYNNKLIGAYNYAALLQQQQQQQQQQVNMYHHMHSQYEEMFAQMRQALPAANATAAPVAYLPNTASYLMDEFYQFNVNNLTRLKRYKALNTLDRTEYMSESVKKYQKQLLKQQQQAWKKATLDSNYRSSEYISASKSSGKKSKSKKSKFTASTYDTYSKYNIHNDLKSSLKTTKTFKSDDLIDSGKRTPKSLRGNMSQLSNSAHSSEASKSRLTESCNSSSKSSDKLSIPHQQQVNVPPPPPPAPPLTEDLFKRADNSFLFTRKKKIRKPLLIDADELASKSFDAVVDELKFKLERLRTSDENLSRFNTLLNRTIPKEIRPNESPKLKLINYSDNFKNVSLVQSSIEKTQSNSSIYSSHKLDSKSNKSIQMETVSKLSVSSQYSTTNNKKHIESCSSFGSIHDGCVSSKKPNSVKFTNTANINTATTMSKSSTPDEKKFKLEIYDSNGEESDDYTKYTRLKFTPTPKNETSKFIDDKINYAPNDLNTTGDVKLNANQESAKKFEFFTQNLFHMVNTTKHTTNKKNTNDLETKIDQYKNEFKEHRMPLVSGPFIKIVKTTLTNQGNHGEPRAHEKSYASLDGNLRGEVKSDTSSSGIDSANYLNSDDDLNHVTNNNTKTKTILKANSVENFLIPSKFSSFTDYNLAKKLNENLNKSKEIREEELEVINQEDDAQNYAKLNSQFEFNEYNKICDQINDFVSIQNNYFSAEFELSNDDNQMLNKYLNQMTSYYQNLNNQEFEHATFIE